MMVVTYDIQKKKINILLLVCVQAGDSLTSITENNSFRKVGTFVSVHHSMLTMTAELSR